jgi:hypothetical protein
VIPRTYRALLIVAAPLGTAIGGPIVGSLGARWTLIASRAATVLLAGLAAAVWNAPAPRAHLGMQTR